MKTLWRNALLITMNDERRSRPQRADLLVDGSVISAVGAHLAVVDSPDITVIDGTHLLIVPGLINAHMHSWESLFRGTSERVPLELWTLTTYPIVDAVPVPPRLVYLRTLVAALDALHGGTTSVLDDVGELPAQSRESLDAVFQAYDDIGIRATCTGGVVDVAPVDRVPFAAEILSDADLAEARAVIAPSAAIVADYLAFSADAFRRHHGRSGRLRYAVAPSAPQRSTDDLLLAASELAREHDAVLHLHLLETRMQAVLAHQRYGETIVEHLATLGLLQQPLTLAHAIWLTESDIRQLGQSPATLVHNPISNLKLGSGVLAWRRLHDAGATLALGTDGTASNDSLRMLEVIKQAALQHTLSDPDPATWPSTDEVLWAATRGGASATGLADRVGALEAGREADFVVIDLTRTSNFTPLADAARQLVFSEDGTSIVEVWVAGQKVISEGRSTLVDEVEVLREFRELAEQYHRDTAAVREANDALVPFVSQVYGRSSRVTWPLRAENGEVE